MFVAIKFLWLNICLNKGMKIFTCTHCNQLVYFENDRCEHCGHQLGFDPEALQLVTLNPLANNWFTIFASNNTNTYRYCANYRQHVCNWLIPVNNSTPYCKACDINRTVPNSNTPNYFAKWQIIETAKHRLVYSLLRLNLPLCNKIIDPEKGLAFNFVSNGNTINSDRVLTGHDNGLITINIAEADDIEREMARKNMDELYRTVLGHFRHEIGHYYWDRLIADTNKQAVFRQYFGDETINYELALQKHYAKGVPANWNQFFISPYATTHPWEDWAETWAHYLHIMDTLETAFAFGLSIHPGIAKKSSDHNADINTDPYTIVNFSNILSLWLPLTFAMNSLDRSMGLNDPYPFIIPQKVVVKLHFIHNLCYGYHR